MSQILTGTVAEVVDGDTYKLAVDTAKAPWVKIEIIRMANVNAPEMNTAAGVEAKKQLSKRLLGKTVKIEVVARDVYGRLVAKIIG